MHLISQSILSLVMTMPLFSHQPSQFSQAALIVSIHYYFDEAYHGEFLPEWESIYWGCCTCTSVGINMTSNNPQRNLSSCSSMIVLDTCKWWQLTVNEAYRAELSLSLSGSLKTAIKGTSDSGWLPEVLCLNDLIQSFELQVENLALQKVEIPIILRVYPRDYS